MSVYKIKQVRVKAFQTIFDIAIQEYQNAEAVFAIMMANLDKISSITQDLIPGDILIVWPGELIEDVARNEESLKAAAIKLHDMLDARQVMITLSELGVFMSCRTNGTETSFILPAHVRAIADVSGAGDTVISVASLLLALGRPYEEVAWFANLAGGLVCEEVGVVPVNPEKLLNEALQLL